MKYTCPNNHPANELAQCTELSCAYCDPIIKKPTRRKEGLSLQRKDRKRS